jgi:hypothetical protein
MTEIDEFFASIFARTFSGTFSRDMAQIPE